MKPLYTPETVTATLGQLPELSDVKVILAQFIFITLMQEVAVSHTRVPHVK